MNARTFKILGLSALSVVLVGCNATGAMTPEEPIAPATAPTKAGYTPNSDAGLEPKPISDPNRIKGALALRAGEGAPRSDPFALTASEQNFERQQELERVLGQAGGFSTQITPKPEVPVVATPPEPQPYRRLSGIVVGDSILAILEESGRAPVIVTPGMQLPNSEWRVLSIDQDKAVLVRSGKTLPTQVVVRLETPRFDQAPANGGGMGYPGASGGTMSPGMSPGGGRPTQGEGD